MENERVNSSKNKRNIFSYIVITGGGRSHGQIEIKRCSILTKLLHCRHNKFVDHHHQQSKKPVTPMNIPFQTKLTNFVDLLVWLCKLVSI